MRVVYDYGFQRLGPPPPRPDIAGQNAEQAEAATTRRQPVVIVHIGPEAQRQARALEGGPVATSEGREVAGLGGLRLVERTSDEAKARDAAVRAHEAAHQHALGPYAAGGIHLQTVRGADGESLAVGGSIRADLSEVPGDPRATLRKANAVRRAALAVSSPSSADLRVAAQAYRMARDARQELRADLYA